MQVRQWLVTTLALCTVLAAPALAADEAAPAADQPAAVQLPAACVDAGLTTEAECKALFAQQKAAAKAAKKAAEKAAADQANADKAAAEKAANDQAAAEAAAASKAAAKAEVAAAKAAKAAADKAAQDQAAAEKAASEKAAADQAQADKAAAAQAAKDQAAAEAAAANKAAAKEKAAAAKAAADQAAQDQAAAEKAASEKAAADQAQADKAAAAQAAKDQVAAEAAAAIKAAAKEKAAAAKAAADQAAQDQAAAEKAAADAAAAQQAGADKAAADAAAAQAAAAKADANKAAAAAADQTAADKAAKDQAAVDEAAAKLKGDKRGAAKAAAKAAAENAAADKAAADAATAGTQPADTPAAKPAPKAQRALAQECINAGLTKAEDCDALRAIAAQKAIPKPADPAAAEPPPAAAEQAEPAKPAVGEVAPVAPAGGLPAEVTPAAPPAAKAAEALPPAAPALPDIAKPLNAAAKSYNRSVAALAKAGADPAVADKAKAKIDAAQAEIDSLCKSNKFDSTAQCLAQFAIELSPVPITSGVKQAAVTPVQPVEVIDTLPKGVSKDAVAPLLDSAKDQETGKGGTPQVVPAKPTPAQAAALNAPPPKSDKAAQAGLKPEKIVSIDQQQGQKLDASAPAQVQVPQNVTIVQNTVINNTITNNTTNNTTNNSTQINNPDAPVTVVQGDQRGKPGKPRRDGQPNSPIGLSIGIVLQFGNQLIISSTAQDQQRIAYRVEDRTSYERLPFGRFRETILRPDGARIVTVYNRNGDVLRRSRIGRDGREIILAYFEDSDAHDRDLLAWHDPGEDLPPLRLRIPAREYVLDSGRADQAGVQQFFAQPPVERVRRLYSLAEVKRSSRIRDMVRRLEIGDLTFNTGAATISQDQVRNLSKVAGAMLQLLERNPAETFLIEGHTDAVGSDISNLQLSDARAATIAKILTDFYEVPPENLATQGYGERYLKVQTELPERLNRRVTVRRITSLVTLSRN